MSEWTRPAQPVRCVVELDKPLTVRREHGVLAQGDANANAIIAEVYQTVGVPYDLTGCTAVLTFVRPDNNALSPINAEISGNKAVATLPEGAYELSGMYAASMQLRKDGAERTVVWLVGEIRGKNVNGIVDPEHVISIEDLMASAVEAQQAASAANAAATRANAGADRVEQMQIDASGLAGDSNRLGGQPASYYLPAEQLDGLRAYNLTIVAGESIDIMVNEFAMLFSRVTAVGRTPGLYIISSHSIIRQPMVNELIAGNSLTISVSGDNSSGWIVSITNTHEVTEQNIFILSNNDVVFVS